MWSRPRAAAAALLMWRVAPLKAIVGGLPDDKLLDIMDGQLIGRVVSLVVASLGTPGGIAVCWSRG